MKKNTMDRSHLKLYWVTTEDHAEDWFIIAVDEFEAALEFARFEGYDSDEPSAEYILDIPAKMIDGIMPDEFDEGDWRWPSNETLVALGARFISDEPERVVEINGITYAEGMLESIIRTVSDNAFEDLGQGRPNGSKPETTSH